MNEIILTACVLRNNWEPIYCKRHWDGIFVKKNIYNENTTQEQQWFWTTKSRFIDRKEAYQLAHKNWQLKRFDEDWRIILYEDNRELYSEDLW